MFDLVARTLLANLLSPLTGIILFLPYLAYGWSRQSANDSRAPRRIFAYSLVYVIYLQVALHFSTSLDNAKDAVTWTMPYGSYLLFPCFFTLLVMMHATETRRRFRQIVAVALGTNVGLVALALAERQYQALGLPASAINDAAIRNNVLGTAVLLAALSYAIRLLPRQFAVCRPAVGSLARAIAPALALDGFVFAGVLASDSAEPLTAYGRLLAIILISNWSVSGLVLLMLARFLDRHRDAIIAQHQLQPVPDATDYRWLAARALGRERGDLVRDHHGEWVIYLGEERLAVVPTYPDATVVMVKTIAQRRSGRHHPAQFLIVQLLPAVPPTRLGSAALRATA